ncbi:L-lysine exporter family protein LysE/ArgO [Labedella gwakjiensis]|uniref:Amino acid transporter n=1 Tax=Labedella gwakjiensis TaxID=390269 RepID=A0A2P8GZF3_9MICO|nr:LysE/ArgO family amino acid transporter [Labedella gwakjiensis]PSL39338.1 L-lysine exporter family protein LysE/ArgO [Labedella gwakjiensis]RUQ86245.1 amino acid transporter [Labedella gwakjiensis]
MPSTLVSLFSGLAFGLSLIVAIGAQNVFVLRQGIRREHVALVVVTCAVSDAILIVVGVAGVGGAVSAVPWLVPVATIGGAAFLVGYAALALRRALRPAALASDTAGERAPWGSVLLGCLAITWLNPHVYLDTVVLLGSIATGFGTGRWWFGLGAIAASVAWFTAIGFGARLLAPLLARPGAWRVVDGVVAAVMLLIAGRLVWGLLVP